MRPTTTFSSTLRVLAALLMAAVVIPAAAHVERNAPGGTGVTTAAAPTIASSPKQRAAQIFFSERKLLTQRGEEVAFYSDVLRDKVVVIDFIYTQCTDSCPTQTARLAEVKSLLGDRLGHGVLLVSISVDPATGAVWAAAEYSAAGSSRDWGTAAAEFNP